MREGGELPEQVEVAIVGAGFGGLGMAIALRRANFEDFVVLERAEGIGGTWRANRYPGAQCDVPSNLYSFSFAPKSDWTHSYPEQPQLLAYLHECARRFGVEPHVHLNCELTAAQWDGDGRHWELETARGALRARVLIAAPGLLSEPRVPSFPGLDRFEGEVFHSADWREDAALAGKRVGLLGTGASAIQIGPRIQPDAASLTVFQRTAPWIIPQPDRAISPLLKRVYGSVPGVQRLVRGGVYALREGLAAGMVYEPRLLKAQEATARAQIRLQLRDPALREAVTPRYAIGCKRILLSNDWYPMLAQPNVELVASAVESMGPRTVVTTDGREHALDALILATGFSPSDPPIAHRLRGREGRTLADSWQGSPHAYLGTAVHGFPNLFLLYGPNVNLGHSSIVYMLESQARYVLDGLRSMRERRLAALEVRADVQEAWNGRIAQRLGSTVWDRGGCSSWYLDANGRNSIMWPGFTFEFRRRTRALELGDYRVTASPA
jgi:cation diffusion facilitator CzcD-associated flavoprotein CzcO